MPNVAPTSLTTSAPGDHDLSLADGFALFPWLGVIRGPVVLDDEIGTLFDKTINLEVIRIELSATHQAFMGVAGPSIAYDVDTDASTSYEIPAPGQQATGTLAVKDSAARGGFQAGIVFGIDIGVDITADLIVKKKNILDFDAGIDIDVIELIYELVMQLLAGGGGGEVEGDPNEYELSTFSADNSGDVEQLEVEEGEPSGQPAGKPKSGSVSPSFTGSGMVAYSPDPFTPIGSAPTTDTPQATLEPSLGIQFSIVPLFAEIPFLDILYGLDESLQAIGGGFEFGPQLNVGLPTTVSLTGVTIGNHTFDITESQAVGTAGDAEFTLQETAGSASDPSLQPLGASVDEIGVLLEHEVGIEVGLSFFAEMTFFKVAHIGASTGIIPLFYSSLPDGAGGPFQNHLSFVPGGGPVPFDAPTDAPSVTGYTANQPQGVWQGGVVARYAVSYYDSDYETPLGPFSAYDQQARFFALAELDDVPTGPLSADSPITGRRIYRQFNDGSEPVQVGEIADNQTTTFTDTAT